MNHANLFISILAILTYLLVTGCSQGPNLVMDPTDQEALPESSSGVRPMNTANQFTPQGDREVYFDAWTPWVFYSNLQVISDFGGISLGVNGSKRAQIDAFGRLRVAMPKGKWGVYDTGLQFRSPLTPSAVYALEYQVIFDGNQQPYDFTSGGKLPGLGGGVAYSGGKPATNGDGFSVRFMFGTNRVTGAGKIWPYVYHYDQPGVYGDWFGVSRPISNGAALLCTLRVEIQLNTGVERNGQLRMWVNGQPLLNKTDLRFRTNSCQIDRFWFETFHGGDTADYAPNHTQYLRYDWVKIHPRI